MFLPLKNDAWLHKLPAATSVLQFKGTIHSNCCGVNCSSLQEIGRDFHLETTLIKTALQLILNHFKPIPTLPFSLKISGKSCHCASPADF